MYSAQTETWQSCFVCHNASGQRLITISSQLLVELRSGTRALLIHKSSWGKVKSHNKIVGYCEAINGVGSTLKARGLCAT